MAFIKQVSDNVLKLLFYFMAPFYFVWIRFFSTKQVVIIKKEKTKVDDENVDGIIQAEVFMNVSVEPEDQMDMTNLEDSDLYNVRQRCWKLSLSQLEKEEGKSKGMKSNIRKNMKYIVDFLNIQQESDYVEAAAKNKSLVVPKSKIVVEDLEDTVVNDLKIPFIVDASRKLIIVYKKKDRSMKKYEKKTK